MKRRMKALTVSKAPARKSSSKSSLRFVRSAATVPDDVDPYTKRCGSN
jgi:hypothetical protein